MSILERTVVVDETEYKVLITDEKEALLAAKAAGRVFVGLDTGNLKDVPFSIPYWVEDVQSADERYLERIVRRFQGLPWTIASSERITLRELTVGDVEELNKVEKLEERKRLEEEQIFLHTDSMEAYIKNQYGFYEYGIWAVERNDDRKLIGLAGVFKREYMKDSSDDQVVNVLGDDKAGDDIEDGTDGLELGYRIFTPYRRQGYALEACQLILAYVKEEYELPVYAMVENDNLPSINLLKKLSTANLGYKD